MTLSKIVGVVVFAAIGLMAFAGTASGTTLKTNGVLQTGAVTIDATSTGSLIFSATGGGFANTCTESTIHIITSVTTGPTVSGPVDTWTFHKCTTEPYTFDAAGSLSIELIGSGPNGTVRSNGAKWTEPSPFGNLTCTTSNTDIGTLTGTVSGTTTLDINAVLNCGFFLPSAKWEGRYTITGHSISATS